MQYFCFVVLNLFHINLGLSILICMNYLLYMALTEICKITANLAFWKKKRNLYAKISFSTFLFLYCVAKTELSKRNYSLKLKHWLLNIQCPNLITCKKKKKDFLLRIWKPDLLVHCDIIFWNWYCFCIFCILRYHRCICGSSFVMWYYN